MRRRSLPAALLACAVLAACGGGSGTGAAKAPSKDEYAAAADRLCVALDKRVTAVTSHRPRSAAEIGAYLDGIVAVFQDGVRRFEALRPPDGAAGRPARAYVAKLGEEIRGRVEPAVRRAKAAVARHDARGFEAARRDVQGVNSGELRRLARAAGTKQC